MSSSPETDSKREGDTDYLEELEIYNNSTSYDSGYKSYSRNEFADEKRTR